MLLFSGSSNKPLAEKITQIMGLSLSPLEIFTFPDGEHRIQLQVPVLGKDTVILQSTNPPVDANYMELFLIIDALKRSGAKSITIVMPYMGYMRQDHIFREGEAVSLLVIVKIIEALKVDRFISFDLHTIKIPEFFHIPVDHLSALPIFANEIKKRRWADSNSILVSPDMGGLRRIKEISTLLNDLPWIATVKHRDLKTGEVTISGFEAPMNKNQKFRFDETSLKGKRALIVDDMISGGSIIETVKYIKQFGVAETYIFVTHPIFSSKTPRLLQESVVDGVFVTDGVIVSEQKRFPKLQILSIADQIAKELKTR